MSARIVFTLLSVVVASVSSSVVWAGHQDLDRPETHSVLARGEAGRLLLAFGAHQQSDAAPLKANALSATIGVRGEFNNGRMFWLDRAPSGNVVVGVGYVSRF